MPQDEPLFNRQEIRSGDESGEPVGRLPRQSSAGSGSEATSAAGSGPGHGDKVDHGAGRGLVSGLVTTARTMLRPAHTREYPYVAPGLPPRSCGVIALLEENCTSCMGDQPCEDHPP